MPILPGVRRRSPRGDEPGPGRRTAPRHAVPRHAEPRRVVSSRASELRSALLRASMPRVLRRRVAAVALLAAAALVLLTPAPPAAAFCGFYVAKADTELFNRASKVVMVRDGGRTVLTMVNDYQGDPEEFALVVPVPTVLQEGQIHVGNRAAVDHLDAYTAPRLVEYYDEDPCRRLYREEALSVVQDAAPAPGEEALGVTVEASYSVGEYDVLILSAEESEGLETWLRRNGYRVPEGAAAVLGSYLAQGMRFFVAKVDLAERQRLGYSFLRPLQIAYEHRRFMLPIRLGTVNADGPQELFVFTLTRTGRVETTNYRTVRLPSGQDVPLFVGDEFGEFYRALFDHQVAEHDMRAVFLEYAWDMAWCDPCAAEPLSASELHDLGVWWIDRPTAPQPRRGARPPAPTPAPTPAPQDVFVTRLHLRYDAARFPEDLQLQETGDRGNFQGRYVLRHPWTGSSQCPAAERYREALDERRRQRARTLADLTGWELAEIHRRMGLDEEPVEEVPWWRRLWPGR